MNLDNKVSFRVAGLQYTVKTDMDPDDVMRIAQVLDRRVMEAMRGPGNVSATQATVLAALGFAQETQAAAREIASLREQLRESLEDAAQAKSERDVLRRELAKYKRD